MPVLNCIENGYLQFLRVLTVAGATIGLVGTIGVGIYAVSNYNVDPKPIPDHVSIAAASYQLPVPGDAAGSRASSSEAAPAAQATDPLADKLAGQWLRMITAQGKKILGPSYAPQTSQAKLSEFYSMLLHKPEYGQAFLDDWRNYTDAVLDRPDVVKYINQSRKIFIEVVAAASANFESVYLSEEERIAKEKEVAQGAADAKRASAIASLPIIGALFAGFIVFALLLLLIRAERSIRQVATTQANAH